mmetsp:Transcript_23432/g.51442  ORF Transcript_23432/g.51442 Transcript_23432/m.51442 type:complete len:387 (-) Transcript_23432:1015-2175(-)|eukprot:CAMPEP_0202891996 /NCGR_PEP_ID=MMETSP1392-20130828/1872_1 /ASSEMBLY_ACC=CAM_ASM_000868 /TAXON_ID=225041 /ORGANISM="Chlamydomonas chlamydogama, Strain SAG 11-48b" /LENGTH=386 /DNA_ID=CAMNT_0049575871 /DNA_START=233 /DNA_END=1393 /DNA_ORIENTATION=+
MASLPLATPLGSLPVSMFPPGLGWPIGWPIGFPAAPHDPKAVQQAQLAIEALELHAKLSYLCTCTQQKFGASHICVFQAWLALGDCNSVTATTDVTLYADPSLGVVGDSCFQDFRARSCQFPLQYKNSMPGRVWRTGAVQIVQSLKIIPPCLHPRSQLKDDDLEKLAEVLYIPVFDVTRPTKGPVTVLEVFLSAKAPEAMLVADFISFITATLAAVNLSVSNPLPQPIRKSALCGRRARAPDSNSDMQQEDEKEREGSETQEESESRPKPAQPDHSAEASGGPQPSSSHAQPGQAEAPVMAERRAAAPAGQQPQHEQHEQHEPCRAPPRKVRRTSGLFRSKSMHVVTLAASEGPAAGAGAGAAAAAVPVGPDAAAGGGTAAASTAE